MSKYPASTSATLDRLVEMLSGLPGIGPKSAQRIAFYLLRAPGEQARELAEAIVSVKKETRLCSSCFNITDTETCPICSNPKREQNIICIVEQPQDILSIEHTGAYKGRYHVLHGALSPTEGVGMEDLRLKELMERLKDGNITEVIMATNPTMEGESTSMYISRAVTPLGIRVTRLARGLPYGTELEYADDVTLTRALEGRQEF